MIANRAMIVGMKTSLARSSGSAVRVRATWVLGAMPTASGRPRNQLAAFMTRSMFVGPIPWTTLSAIDRLENRTSRGFGPGGADELAPGGGSDGGRSWTATPTVIGPAWSDDLSRLGRGLVKSISAQDCGLVRRMAAGTR